MLNSKLIFLRNLVLGIAILVLGAGSAFSQVNVTLPNISGQAGTTGTIPVTVGNLTGQNVFSFQFDVYYDPTIINITGASTLGLALTGGTDPTVNPTSGRLRVAWARGTPISGAGTLINLNVSFLSPGTSAITFVDPALVNTFMFNAGNPAANTTAGTVTVPSIAVRFDNVTNVGRNDTILIPISTTALTAGNNIYSLNFSATFDQTVIQVLPDPFGVVTTGGLGAGGTTSINPNNTNGTVNVAWARGTAMTGTGVMFWIRARVVGLGTATLNFTAFQFNAGTPAAGTFSGTVTSVNRAPTIGAISAQTVAENSLLTFTAVGSDVDGDALTYSLTGTPPTGASINATTGVFSWTPNYDQAGSYNVTVRVTDALALFAETTVAITVTNTNRAPSLAAISAQTVAENSLLTFTAVGTDPDGDALTYTLTGTPPTGASIDASTGVFTWTPGYDAAGSYTVTIRAADAGGLFAEISVNITVTNTNRAPSLAAISAQTVAENSTLTFTAVGTDPDGDVLTYSLTGTPPTSASINASTGVFSWTPTYDQAGSYNVTIRVTDAGSLFAETTVAITVTGTNRKPVFTALPAQSGRVGDELSFTVSAADPDGDAITYSYIGTPPTGATFNAITRTLTWVPTNAQVGTNTLRFKAQDPGGLYDSMAVVVNVVRINRAPYFTKQMPDTTAKTHQAFSYKYEAADPEKDAVRFYLVSSIAGAKIDSVTGVFTWTPVKSQVGLNNVVVVISDGELSTTSRISQVNVILANNPPVFTKVMPDTAIKENQAYTFQYTGSDPDAGDVLKFGLVVKPTGAVIDSVTGLFSWTPTYAQGRVAPYTVITTLYDGYTTVRDTASITVQNVNRPPIFTQRMPDTTINAEKLFTFKFIASDPDVDPFYYMIVSGPAGVTINNLGTFFWTPTSAQAYQTYTLVVGARDYADTTKVTNSIKVNPPVGVEGETPIPDEFSLYQNYPNPFNPSTQIKYAIPQESKVALKVFNTIGEEIATLVNGIQQAGYYSYQFDASKLQSGIYFYRLQAGNFVSTKKMMYIK